jgi:4-amino-4-deoxy-L-arabinose transferase-like glycosyltransferase
VALRTSPPTWALLALAALAVVATSVWSIAACGPWDPWETHYGEVARQILVRNDPLDLWWRPGGGPDGNAENTFWSKPALPYWLMALSMWLLGVGTGRAPDEMVRGPWPELAIRLPSLLTGLACAAFLGWACARILAAARPLDPGQPTRAGLYTALALCTMPQWAIVTRQALTDMFFVAPVTVAMAAWALAWLRPDRELRRRPLAALLPRRLRDRLLGPGPEGHVPADLPPASPRPGRLAAVLRREIPWDRAYLGFLLVFLVAVVAPILVLDAHVSSDRTVERVSTFVKKPGVPNFGTLVKIHQVMLGYAAVALLLLVRTLRWRTASQTWMGILYIAAGVSLVGKGLIGPGLVGLLVLLHLLVTARLTPTVLWRCGLVTGLALFALASLPWHHAMWIYRGDSWLNELIIVNNLARFGSGEQDQAVGGFAYYLRTLGLAALPWSAALPAVLWAAARRLRATTSGHAHLDMSSPPGPNGHAPPADPAGELWRLGLLWFCATLALLTTSVTKYYHYLLPALPPFALLVGLWLSDPAPPPRDRRLALAAAGLGVALLALVMRDVLVEPAWIVHLTTYLYDHMWRNGAPTTTGLLVGAVPFALGLFLWAARQRTAGAVAMLLAGFLTLNYTLNSYLPAVREHWSQRTAIRYYYDNRGPDDPLASWWFYYRGETFFTKGAVWVKKEADRESLAELVEANRGQGRTLWLITTGSHINRAKSSLPNDVRRTSEVAYENAHYALLRAPIP